MVFLINPDVVLKMPVHHNKLTSIIWRRIETFMNGKSRIARHCRTSMPQPSCFEIFSIPFDAQAVYPKESVTTATNAYEENIERECDTLVNNFRVRRFHSDPTTNMYNSILNACLNAIEIIAISASNQGEHKCISMRRRNFQCTIACMDSYNEPDCRKLAILFGSKNLCREMVLKTCTSEDGISLILKCTCAEFDIELSCQHVDETQLPCPTNVRIRSILGRKWAHRKFG